MKNLSALEQMGSICKAPALQKKKVVFFFWNSSIDVNQLIH